MQIAAALHAVSLLGSMGLDFVKRCVPANYETRYHVPYNVQDRRNLGRQEEKGLQARVMSDNLENNASLLRSQLIQAALHSGMRTRVGISERQTLQLLFQAV